MFLPHCCAASQISSPRDSPGGLYARPAVCLSALTLLLAHWSPCWDAPHFNSASGTEHVHSPLPGRLFLPSWPQSPSWPPPGVCSQRFMSEAFFSSPYPALSPLPRLSFSLQHFTIRHAMYPLIPVCISCLCTQDASSISAGILTCFSNGCLLSTLQTTALNKYSVNEYFLSKGFPLTYTDLPALNPRESLKGNNSLLEFWIL